MNTDYDRVLPDHVPEQILPGRRLVVGDVMLTVERLAPDAMYSGPTEYEGFSVGGGWIAACSTAEKLSDYDFLRHVAGLGIHRGEERWVVYEGKPSVVEGREMVYLYLVQFVPAVVPVLDRILE